MSASPFEYVNASEIPPELRCPVCTNPWVDAVEAPCGDIFCGACLPTEATKCPACGVQIEEKCVTRAAPRQLINMADRLVVKCPFAGRGCGWQGKRSDCAGHTQTCTFSTEAPKPKLQFVNEDKIDDEYSCSICHEPWTEPVLHTQCDSVFCGPCLRKTGSTDCPICRGTIADDTVRAPPKQLLSMRARLPVYCLNKNNGCAWQGPAADFEVHAPACTFDKAAAPAPTTTSIALSAKKEFAAIKTGADKTVTMLHLDAPVKAIDDEKRKPVNVSAVIDISGSMSGEKLKLAKETMQFVVGELGADDILGLVAFDDRVEEVMPPIVMNETGKQSALAAIATLQARGSTNLSGGLFAGIDQARHLPFTATSYGSQLRRSSAPRKKSPSMLDGLKSLLSTKPAEATPASGVERADGTVNAVWLFTDGQANCGITDPRQLVNATRDKLASHVTDVTVYTFGFGAGHNADLLKSIAETCDGSYYYIENTEMMTESFADCLGGLMSVVAQNIKLQVTCAPGVTIDRLMTSYTNTVTGNTAEVVLKDLYSEEKRDILLSLNTAAVPAGLNVPLATWTLKCLNAVTGAHDSFTAQCTVNVVDILPAGMEVDADVDEQRNRFLATEAMEKARAEAEQGRMREAQECLRSAMDVVACSKTAGTAYVQHLQDDMLEAQNCALDEQTYMQSGSKCMAQMAWGHARQRCNRADEGALYENHAKKAMKCKSKKSFF